MAEYKTNAMRILEKANIPYRAHTYDAAGGIGRVGVRRGGDRQGSGDEFHFAASFSRAAASRSIRLAVRKLCTSGIPAGQP